MRVGARSLNADLLGGFYSLDGYYPGKTGQALIANGILELLNENYGTAFELVDVAKVMERDPVAMYQLAEGPDFTLADLTPPAGAASEAAPPVPVEVAATGARAGRSERATLPLTLPPGLEQVLPLSTESSYYGDALRPVHTTDPAEIGYGLSGNLLFGGLALLDSHLSGLVRIKFSPPVNGVSHFEVTHGEGLAGTDGRLSAPQFFKLPGVNHKLLDPQDVVSSGDLDLATGAVANLKYRLFFLNSAIFALAQVNPRLPKEPINFPGQYGSAWARFEQRADGLLDFEFYGTTFIPMSVLGAPARFPLPFVSPTLSFASIPCDGTALHPHIHLSTMPPEGPDEGVEVPELPVNTIQVFTGSPYNNYFGDDFSLNAPELGSRATGRSHLMGRYQIQFGERFGDSLQFAISSMQPGGLLTTLRQSPFAQAFGKRIPDCLLGYDEFLRFRNQTYAMDQISFLDDPLDLAVGAVDLKTGKVIGHLLRARHDHDELVARHGSPGAEDSHLHVHLPRSRLFRDGRERGDDVPLLRRPAHSISRRVQLPRIGPGEHDYHRCEFRTRSVPALPGDARSGGAEASASMAATGRSRHRMAAISRTLRHLERRRAVIV